MELFSSPKKIGSTISSLPPVKLVDSRLIRSFLSSAIPRMSRALLLTRAVTVWSSGISDNDACHFVASRFAHTLSECHEGFCVGISRNEVGVFLASLAEVAVTCEAARDVMDEFFADSVGTSDLDTDATGVLLIDLLDAHVNPLLSTLTLGCGVPADNAFGVLKSVSTTALALAARNWPQWRSETVPYITNHEVMKRFSETIDGVSWMILRRSATEDHSAAVAVIWFYFDFVALLGRHFISSVVAAAAGAAFTSRLYRRPTAFESYAYISPFEGFLGNENRLVEVSKAIDRLVGSHQVFPLDDVMIVTRSLVDCNNSPESSAKVFLRDQLLSTLCPRLPIVLMALKDWTDTGPFTVKFGVTLIAFCREAVDEDRLLEAVDILGSLVAVPPRELTVAALADGDIPFEYGFPDSVKADERGELAAQLASAVFNQYLHAAPTPDGDFRVLKFPQKSPNEAWTVGRALGLCVRYGVELRDLHLSPALVLLLHPRSRLELPDRRALCKALNLLPDCVEELTTAYQLMSGLEEALGPGGTCMFTDRDWFDLFL